MMQLPQPDSGRHQAVAYVRQSSCEQAQRVFDPDRQLTQIANYCAREGLPLGDHIRDIGVDGDTPLYRRPGGGRLAQLVSKDQVGNLVVLSLDRLWTRPSEALWYIRWWWRRGVVLHLLNIDGQPLTLSGHAGELFVRTATEIIRMQHVTQSTRVKAALARKRERHERWGNPRFGWQAGDDGRLIPHTGERALVQRVRDMQAAGLSLRKIASILAAEGIKTRRGSPMHRSAVHHMLQIRF